ncbi:hypothetical protein ACLOJK_004508 [Asimina triloba]
MGGQRRPEMEGMMIVNCPSSEWGAVVAAAARDRDRGRWRRCCRLWGRMDGRIVPSEKMIGDSFAVVGAWIRAIGCVHKNQAMMMVPSGLDMVVDRRRGRSLCRRQRRWNHPCMLPPLTMACSLTGSRVGSLLLTDGQPGLSDPVPAVDGYAGDERGGGYHRWDGGDIAVARWGLLDLKGAIVAVDLSGSDLQTGPRHGACRRQPSTKMVEHHKRFSTGVPQSVHMQCRLLRFSSQI